MIQPSFLAAGVRRIVQLTARTAMLVWFLDVRAAHRAAREDVERLARPRHRSAVVGHDPEPVSRMQVVYDAPAYGMP